MRLARRNIVVPEVLIKLALHEKDNTEGCYGDYSARIIIEFSDIERVEEPVTVWQSERLRRSAELSTLCFLIGLVRCWGMRSMLRS